MVCLIKMTRGLETSKYIRREGGEGIEDRWLLVKRKRYRNSKDIIIYNNIRSVLTLICYAAKKYDRRK